MATYDVHGAPLRRFSVRDYQRMHELGLFDPDERVELLDGVIVAVATETEPHALIMERLNVVLIRTLAGPFRVRTLLPMIPSAWSQPAPDFVVSAREKDPRGHPRDALLIVEAAQTSLRKDRKLKLRIYAQARVPEYWIINVKAKTIEVYRKPSAKEGTYRVTKVYRAGQVVKPVDLPGPTLDVAALFA